MKPWHWWRTVFYLIPAVTIYTVVLGTASLLSTLFDRSGNFGHACARTWSWLILKTTGVEVDVEGLERLDRSRSYVFASNHQSLYDIPILFASLPFQLRIIAKDSLGRIPFMGWHLQRTGLTVVGSRHVMFRGEVMVRPGRVRVIVHDPVETVSIPREAVREFASTVRDVVASSAA